MKKKLFIGLIVVLCLSVVNVFAEEWWEVLNNEIQKGLTSPLKIGKYRAVGYSDAYAVLGGTSYGGYFEIHDGTSVASGSYKVQDDYLVVTYSSAYGEFSELRGETVYYEIINERKFRTGVAVFEYAY